MEAPACQQTPPFATQQQRLSKLYVLSIGINCYSDEERLRYTAKDAKEFARVCQQQSRSLDRECETQLLLNWQANKDGILQSLNWLEEQMTSRDMAVIFFSGHGFRDHVGDWHLLPAGYAKGNLRSTSVSAFELQRSLVQLPGRVTLFLDCCYAQAFLDEGQWQVLSPTNEVVEDLATMNRDCDRNLLTVMGAAGAWEEAGESAEIRHSYFTKALVEGLSQEREPTKDVFMLLEELHGYVCHRVWAMTGGEQTPFAAVAREQPGDGRLDCFQHL